MTRHPDASQVQRVLAFMQGGRSIESMEAVKRFGCTRLASVVDDLRRAGYNVQTELVPFRSTSGAYSRFARYRLQR